MPGGSDDTFDNDGPAADDTSAPSLADVAHKSAVKRPFVPMLVAFFPSTPVAAMFFSGSPPDDIAPAASTAHTRNRFSCVSRFSLCGEKKLEGVSPSDTAGIVSHLLATLFR
jgi:hypothetical protein